LEVFLQEEWEKGREDKMGIEQIDFGDMIRDALPEEVTIYETNIGQIPFGNIRGDCATKGNHGYHPLAGTMSVVVKVGGAEICYKLSGATLAAYNRLMDGTSGQRRNALVLRFLRRYDLPCEVIGLQL
jgi:hypothetical protein